MKRNTPTTRLLRQFFSELYGIPMPNSARLEKIWNDPTKNVAWFAAIIFDIDHALKQGHDPQRSLQRLADALDNQHPLSQTTLQNLGDYWANATPPSNDFTPVETWLRVQKFRHALRTARLCCGHLQDIAYTEQGDQWNPIAELVDTADLALKVADHLQRGGYLDEVAATLALAHGRLTDAETCLTKEQLP
jgi:hypothetical protein